MSQRSITSFFSKAPAKPLNSNSESNGLDRSAIKKENEDETSSSNSEVKDRSVTSNALSETNIPLRKTAPRIIADSKELKPEIARILKIEKRDSEENNDKNSSSEKENTDLETEKTTDSLNVTNSETPEKTTLNDKKKSSSKKRSVNKSLKEDKEKKNIKKRRKIIIASDSSEDELNDVQMETSPIITKEEKEIDSSENDTKPRKCLENIPKNDSSNKKKRNSSTKKTPKSKKKDEEDLPAKKKIRLETDAEQNAKEDKVLKNSDSETEISEEKTPENKPKTVHPFFNAGKKDDAKTSNSKDPGLSYNPTKSKYHPIDDAFWKRGDKVPYMALARTLECIEETSARLKIIEILSNYLRSVIVLSPESLLASVYLCLNKVAPAYEGLELGLADTYLIKAIAQSTGRTVAQIKADAQATGDIGLVAEKSRSNQRMLFSFQPARLTVPGVFEKLREITKTAGQASMQKKVEKIQSMFVACKHSEARFLIRSLAGKLRIGLAEQSVLQAVALACTMTPPNQSYPPEIVNASKGLSTDSFKAKVDEDALILKTTYCECPNYDKIIPIILEKGIKELPKECKLTPGIPLKPMLAHPTKGIHEVLQRFEGLKFTCEWKYDGERAQIHCDENGKISIYSRNQENNTSKYPDIISRIDNCKLDTVKSFILDCEAVGWDKENKQILPFQILSTRKRKDANEADIKVQVCVFMFDLLYFNGEPLVRKPFAERRRLLKENFKDCEGEWAFATSLDTTVMEEVQEFLDVSVKGNCEGLMIKTLEEDATYEIAKRSRNWLKLKKDYLEGIGDTLDCVVIGGYLGKGKRTGTYGGFLLACYDQDNEEYQSICKIGTGFSDEDLQNHTEFFKAHIISEPKSYYRFDNSHKPDHWFDAVQVWEIKCADLSLSPVHQAGIGIVDPEKGISLRFPRFIRIRDDKNVEDATSAQQVADMYENQDQIKNQQAGIKSNEEDFY